MEGVALRDERELERDAALAWQVARMSAAAQSKGGLKGLKHYLKELKPRKPQTSEEILEVFREHQRRGARMDIRLIRPGEE